MSTIKLLSAILLSFTLMSYTAAAQNQTSNTGSDDKKQTETKVVEKVVEKSGPSVASELRKLLGTKTETSLDGPRVENIGKYFLDKYTGEVTIFAYHRNEPIRWRVLRDNVPEDIITDPQTVNYQMFRIGTSENDIILMNINTGVMWAIDAKPLSINHKKTTLQYIPVTDTEY